MATNSSTTRLSTIVNDSLGIEPGTNILDESRLLSDEDQQPPSYTSLMADPSIDDNDDSPPNYFDISLVPTGTILYYHDAIPWMNRSKAVIERNERGVLLMDALIDRNPDQLWLYFMTYLNEKPQFIINIRSSHTEKSRIVTDFSFNIDVAPYISNRWWRIAVIPSDKAQKKE
ncbi:unnamed protein product [Rotaria sordida]|uniref:Uncharacterized protein n=1 Tax=Rotaria sordida TaxID=392033 RepID=A0A814CYF8_9BILA|nr:unnamed protein product [Rotaria sordida]CAF3669090.1 unnamed protein product [Rotaria sordida]